MHSPIRVPVLLAANKDRQRPGATNLWFQPGGIRAMDAPRRHGAAETGPTFRNPVSNCHLPLYCHATQCISGFFRSTTLHRVCV